MPRKRKITVYSLTREKITPEILEGIAALLKKQHSGAFTPDESYLRNFLARSQIIIATQSKKVVGIGTLVSIECLTHWYAKIYNFVINDDQDLILIGESIAKMLMESANRNLRHIDGPDWLQDPKMAVIFKDLGFKESSRTRFRFKF